MHTLKFIINGGVKLNGGKGAFKDFEKLLNGGGLNKWGRGMNKI